MDKIDRKKWLIHPQIDTLNIAQLDKLDELVEEYNEIRKWIDENLESYIKVLKGLADLDNRLEEYINEEAAK